MHSTIAKRSYTAQMVPGHQTRLLRILAILDQLTAKVDPTIRTEPLSRDGMQKANDLAAEIRDTMLRIEIAFKEHRAAQSKRNLF